MHPKVTIGISFKNPGRYFELAIKSVFTQTFTEWELILIDDGSTDNSLEFAKTLVMNEYVFTVMVILKD